MCWGCSTSQAVGHRSLGIWGKKKFYRMLKEAMQKQGMIGYEVGSFLIRGAGPIF